MNNLVFCNNNKVLTSSRTVATYFERQPKHINESIRSIIKDFQSEDVGREVDLANYFIESTYKDTQGKERAEYLLTKKGFNLLAMNFKGPKALRFKLDYIDAFEAMEQSLASMKQENLELQARLAEHDKEVLTRTLDRTILDLEEAEYKCEILEQHYEELRQYNKELAEDKEAWVSYAEDLENFIQEKMYI